VRALLLVIVALVGCAPGTTGPTDAPPAALVLGDVRFSCDGPPGFLPALLDQPATAETEDHPSAIALRTARADNGQAFEPLPPSGYWLVSRDERIAEYLARPVGAPDREFASATVEKKDGVWKLVGWGNCHPAIVLDGLSRATWTLEAGADAPAAEATSVTALVTESVCTGGQPMGARLLPPAITYGEDSVLIVFAARPLVFDEGVLVTCPGNPASRVEVQLGEPLGERQLLDGGVFPPAEPVPPQF
jgi:hypothetical protein